MLDTIKLGVPLTRGQHEKIKCLADQNDCWQWVLLNPSTGELHFRRTKGLATTDGESFHRELRWEIPHDYIDDDCRLTLEFSVPKFWYGHNIHLLYNFVTPLNRLRDLLNDQFTLEGDQALIDTLRWHVMRADVCYAWRFPSQKLAKRFLDSLKRLHFPSKRPIIYDDSILFSGNTYSVKIYLKLPEFKAHDRKELLKKGSSLEWVNHCEALAEGVLRFEATLRRKYLKRHRLETVDDLTRPLRFIEFDCERPLEEEEEKFAFLYAATFYYLHKEGVSIQALMNGEFSTNQHLLRDGLRIEAPAMELDVNGKIHQLPEGAATFRERDNPTAIAQYLLTKFIGENAGMRRADEVESRLLEVYKPVKAARLISFWLYVQKFGSAKAKDIFGKNSYYTAKSDLKKAGVNLIEPPSGSNITVLEIDFLEQFRMEIPSQFVTNKVDDFRDSGNVLNIIPRLSGEDAS